MTTQPSSPNFEEQNQAQQAQVNNGDTIQVNDNIEVLPPEENPAVEETTTLSPEQLRIVELEKQVRKLEDDLSSMKDQYVRAYAEAENIKKRASKERDDLSKFAVEKFARELLAVKDSLEAGLADQTDDVEKVREGMDITLRQLTQVFEKSKVQEINPINEKFDPNLHQAMSMLPSDQPANTVLQVLQKGYLIHDRVLRPALVLVSKGSE